MITRNYLRIWALWFTKNYDYYRYDYALSNFSDSIIPLKKADGQYYVNTETGTHEGLGRNCFYVVPFRKGGNAHSYDVTYYQKENGGFVTFGEGSAEPGLDDYELTSPISINTLVQLTGKKGKSKVYTRGAYKDRCYWDGQIVSINAGSRALHIREVGFWSITSYGLVDSSCTTLIGHYLIPEVVVQPGDCFVFNYRVMY